MEECINSICNQTYNNLQIILVDDGLTDNSFNICKLFDEHDERILLIHKENGGLVSARKAGAAVAIGDYISFGEDAACSFPCMLSASTIISLDYAPYHYRQREGSIVQSQNEISDDNFIEIYKRLYHVFSDNDFLQEQLNYYMFFMLLLKGYSKIHSNLEVFPFDNILKNEKIYIYGAGAFGKVLKAYIKKCTGWQRQDSCR